MDFDLDSSFTVIFGEDDLRVLRSPQGFRRLLDQVLGVRPQIVVDLGVPGRNGDAHTVNASFLVSSIRGGPAWLAPLHPTITPRRSPAPRGRAARPAPERRPARGDGGRGAPRRPAGPDRRARCRAPLPLARARRGRARAPTSPCGTR